MKKQVKVTYLIIALIMVVQTIVLAVKNEERSVKNEFKAQSSPLH